MKAKPDVEKKLIYLLGEVLLIMIMIIFIILVGKINVCH